MARPPIVTRADVERCYPSAVIASDFVPTHRVRVIDPRQKKRVIRSDLVRLGDPVSNKGVAYAYGPNKDVPLYGVLSTGLWQSLETYGRVEATPVRYDSDYVPPKEREGVVYFIQAGPGGPIKIGWSQEVDRRIAELQTANARKLILLGTVPGTLETEASLHVQFSHLRLEAEWFQDSEEIQVFLRENALKPL